MEDQAVAEWHYSTDGQRVGPIQETQVVALIQEGKITDQSLVWNRTLGDWQHILESKFANLVRDPNAPPPLIGTAVDNTIIWTLTFAPLLGRILEEVISQLTGFPQSSLWVVTLLLNVALCIADEKKLKAAGHDTAKMGAVWLVPVYLFKRAQVLRQNNAYFIVWCVLFGLLLFA